MKKKGGEIHNVTAQLATEALHASDILPQPTINNKSRYLHLTRCLKTGDTAILVHNAAQVMRAAAKAGNYDDCVIALLVRGMLAGWELRERQAEVEELQELYQETT